MERMDDIEDRVNKDFKEGNETQKQQDVTDINNKALLGDHAKMQNEKMKGRFSLTINKGLEMKKRIQKFGNEPICYYLHKNRNFLQKLEDKQVRTTEVEKINDFRRDLPEIQKKERMAIWYARQGVDPDDPSKDHRVGVIPYNDAIAR